MNCSVRRVVFACLLLVSTGLTKAAETSSSHPNIVFILADDMGYGDPKCYNADSKIPTPNIDSLATGGMRFTDAHAAGPLCHMSRYGLLTGRYPFRTNVGKWRRQPLIEDDQMTIASLLQQNGYHTAMVGKWHLGFHENGYDKPLPGGPVDRGFDSFFGIRASTDIPPYFYIRGNQAVQPPTDHIEARNSKEFWTPIQGEFWRAGGIAPDLALRDVLPLFADEAVGVIEDHADSPQKKPLMLYVAFPAPHTPWLPSKEFVGTSKASLYGDFTVMVDAMVGKILQALDQAKMTDNTLVIFSSDNGPTWYDKDVEKFQHDSAAHLRGMKADAWEAGHRVPFIARWPEKIPANSVNNKLVCFTDMLATFAAIVDQELPEDAGPDSFNILPTLLDPNADTVPTRQSFAMGSGNGMMMIRDGNWKLIDGLGSGGFSKPSRIKPIPGEPAAQLYNLADDPGETQNLYWEKPQQVKRLMKLLTSIRRGQHRRIGS
ncbi:sulfatase family protein [Thalassoroseus pseudoceratinae]|uniref:sulfatase family protein n=1 Tax=Thalassoroseus pseudoceratinae TaxID=2713176 RepID=UPI00141E53F0|nr:arylsulfatase [Thalassoroseus pseudoceratinae]